MKTCRNCGGTMIGDGHTEPVRCERAERWEDKEPDCAPVECGGAGQGAPVVVIVRTTK